jgi:hypothetical protein
MKTLELIIAVEGAMLLAFAVGLVALEYEKRRGTLREVDDVRWNEAPAPAATDEPAGAERER